MYSTHMPSTFGKVHGCAQGMQGMSRVCMYVLPTYKQPVRFQVSFFLSHYYVGIFPMFLFGGDHSFSPLSPNQLPLFVKLLDCPHCMVDDHTPFFF